MKLTKIVFSIAATLTLFLLAGCSKENTVSADNQPAAHPVELSVDTPEIEYHLEELALDQTIQNPLYLDARGDALILADMKPDAAAVLRFGEDGRVAEKTPLVFSMEAAANEVSGIRNISSQPYGVWCLNYVQERGVGGDHYQESGYTEVLTRYDPDGTLAVSLELSPEAEVRDVLAVSDGCLLLTDHEILHYTMDAEQDWKIENDAYFANFLSSPDGSIYCATLYDEGYVYRIKDENHALVEVISGCGQADFFYVYENTLYGCDETRLYLYSFETGELVSYLDFSKLGISAVLDAAPYRGGIALIFQSTFGGKTTGLLLESDEPASTTNKLKIVMLRTDGMDFIKGVIELFQLRNPAYSVQLVEYDDLSKFSTALITGDAPDLICLKDLPVEEYSRKGILRNLYDCVDADTLVPAYRQFEIGGGLYTITPDFSLGVLFCDPNVISAPVSSFRDMLAAASASQSLRTGNEFANLMAAYSMHAFVDLEQCTCAFDSSEFEALLALCAPTQGAGSESVLPALCPMEITSLAQYAEIRELGMDCAGFPEGPVISRSSNNLIGIHANAANADAAEQFIRFLLGEEVQNAVLQNEGSFPVSASALQISICQSDPYADSLCEQLEQVQGVDLSSTELYGIIKDELSLLLNGNQSVSVTAGNIQSRVSICLLESN